MWTFGSGIHGGLDWYVPNSGTITSGTDGWIVFQPHPPIQFDAHVVTYDPLPLPAPKPPSDNHLRVARRARRWNRLLTFLFWLFDR